MLWRCRCSLHTEHGGLIGKHVSTRGCELNLSKHRKSMQAFLVAVHLFEQQCCCSASAQTLTFSMSLKRGILCSGWQ